MRRYLVMPSGLATAFTAVPLTSSLLLGSPVRERTLVPARRAVFVHSFNAGHLLALDVLTTNNPTMELLNALPSDWRHPFG